MVSVGRVVENKPFGTDRVKVTPIELLYDQSSGLVADQKKQHKGTLPSAKDAEFETEHESTNIITATWRPVGNSNRMTPPDLRVNEEVHIYQYGDSREYYWEEVGRLPGLRDKEDVLYAWSNKPAGSPSENADEDTSVCIRVNTKDGFVYLKTPNNDNEVAGYEFKIDMKNGIVSMVDTLENSITLNSGEGTLTANINEKITFNTKVIEFNCETYTLNAQTSTTNASDSVTHNTPIVTDTENHEVKNNMTVKNNTTTHNNNYTNNNSITKNNTVTGGLGTGGMEPDYGNAVISGNTTVNGDLNVKGNAYGSYPRER